MEKSHWSTQRDEKYHFFSYNRKINLSVTNVTLDHSDPGWDWACNIGEPVSKNPIHCVWNVPNHLIICTCQSKNWTKSRYPNVRKSTQFLSMTIILEPILNGNPWDQDTMVFPLVLTFYVDWWVWWFWLFLLLLWWSKYHIFFMSTGAIIPKYLCSKTIFVNSKILIL